MCSLQDEGVDAVRSSAAQHDLLDGILADLDRAPAVIGDARIVAAVRVLVAIVRDQVNKAAAQARVNDGQAALNNRLARGEMFLTGAPAARAHARRIFDADHDRS